MKFSRKVEDNENNTTLVVQAVNTSKGQLLFLSYLVLKYLICLIGFVASGKETIKLK